MIKMQGYLGVMLVRLALGPYLSANAGPLLQPLHKYNDHEAFLLTAYKRLNIYDICIVSFTVVLIGAVCLRA